MGGRNLGKLFSSSQEDVLATSHTFCVIIAHTQRAIMVWGAVFIQTSSIISHHLLDRITPVVIEVPLGHTPHT
jgi:hypothetical protein